MLILWAILGVVTLYCTSKGALHNTFESSGLTPYIQTDYDIIHQAKVLLKTLPIKVTTKWVKGHSTATKSPYKRNSTFSPILRQRPLPYTPTQSTLPHIFPYHLQVTKLDFCLTTLSSHPSCITYFPCNCMPFPPEA